MENNDKARVISEEEKAEMNEKLKAAMASTKENMMGKIREYEESADRDGQTCDHSSRAAIQGYHTGYSSPREYLHNFLLQAQSAGADVGSYIDDEIRLLLTELKR